MITEDVLALGQTQRSFDDALGARLAKVVVANHAGCRA